MPGDFLQTGSEILEVVLPLGQQDRRAPLLERLEHIIEDEPVALLVGRECGVQFLDARRLLARRLEARIANHKLVSEGALRRLALRVDKADRPELHLRDGTVPIAPLPDRARPRSSIRPRLGLLLTS
ncbi:MAG: hypothetical protein ACREVJ_01965 [Gammaproteobacteria bacterium]